jgi:hypothetical protein
MALSRESVHWRLRDAGCVGSKNGAGLRILRPGCRRRWRKAPACLSGRPDRRVAYLARSTLSGKDRRLKRTESTTTPRGRSFATLDDARVRLIGRKLRRSACAALTVGTLRSMAFSVRAGVRRSGACGTDSQGGAQVEDAPVHGAPMRQPTTATARSRWPSCAGRGSRKGFGAQGAEAGRAHQPRGVRLLRRDGCLACREDGLRLKV